MRQLCKTCDRPLTQLFYSLSCDWCENGPDRTLSYWECYVVVNPGAVESGVARQGFVFRYYKDACSFRSAFANEIDEVWLAHSLRFIDFKYHETMPYQLQSTLMSDEFFWIHPTHKFKPQGKDVFLRNVV